MENNENKILLNAIDTANLLIKNERDGIAHSLLLLINDLAKGHTPEIFKPFMDSIIRYPGDHYEIFIEYCEPFGTWVSHKDGTKIFDVKNFRWREMKTDEYTKYIKCKYGE